MQTQRLTILTTLQAAAGGITAISIAVLYQIRPQFLQDSPASVVIAGLGAAALIYYFSLHQLLKRKAQVLSAIIISLISALNILFITVTTGGIDSPYFSLWLLAIVVAGFFGSGATLLALGATLAYFGYDFALHNFNAEYIVGHLGPLLIILATGAIAEWLHMAMRGHALQKEHLGTLSGKLTEAELKSEALMNSVGEGVLVVNHDRQIQYFNPSAVKITGWDGGSAQNIDYRLVLSLHDQEGKKVEDKNDPFLQCWREKKNIVRDELIMETKGGKKIAVWISLSPIYDQLKRITGGIALFRDISAEKEVERQRNEFISTASHEMRTPVAAIEGYLSLANNPNVATVDKRAKEFLDKAYLATRHLGELFRDLLSVTKLEDRGSMEHIEPLNLTQLVTEVVDDMQFSARRKAVDLSFAAVGESVSGKKAVLPVFVVSGSPQRLREVVMNLIENALKFAPKGKVKVTIGGNSDAVTVSVADTGIGIAPEDIPHLFQKYYRIDNSATRTIGGTGLGLYLCRTIIEMLGGHIGIESKLGEGTTIRFTLPRISSSALPKSTRSIPAPAPAPKPTKAKVIDLAKK
ncbi:MAG TPA: ATP-binding protein [Candidatus Dormibacteraeota bacterium]|nr:ATP-binding protein [Candidatus Dormibacteraeota bacterium]